MAAFEECTDRADRAAFAYADTTAGGVYSAASYIEVLPWGKGGESARFEASVRVVAAT